MATIETGKLKAYTCPSCAGFLSLNENKTTYICSSCGNTYDYEYFMSDDLLSKAEKALSRKEYKSAEEMYNFLLQKEPINFTATVGLLLSKINAESMDALTPDFFCSGPSYEDSSVFTDHVEEDKKELFVLASECFGFAKDYKKVNGELKSIDSKLSSKRREQGKISSKIQSNYVQVESKTMTDVIHPKQAWLGISLFAAASTFAIGIFFVLGSQADNMLIPFLILIAVSLGVGAIAFLISWLTFRKRAKNIADSLKESESVSAEYAELKSKHDELTKAINHDRSEIANRIRKMKTLYKEYMS